MPTTLERLDDYQRRRPVLGFPLAVVYKMVDDQGSYLAAIVTYYAFVAIFPLLLIASSVLGFVLQGSAQLRQAVLTSALSQFPIVGTQLGQPEGLTGSTGAVVVGGLAALYGVLGLGQAAQNAVNVAWAVPRNSRLNPFVSRWRTFLLMGLAGIVVLLIAMLGSAGSHLEVFGSTDAHNGLRWLLRLASLLLTAVVIGALLRWSVTPRHPWREVAPGAVLIATTWQLLQVGGGVYVSGVIGRASEMNKVFALVLGLFALIYLASMCAVIGIEVNVVKARRLFPRALLTPFTDDVRLTEADRRAYAAYAKAQRHKGFERVRVSFRHRPEDDG